MTIKILPLILFLLGIALSIMGYFGSNHDKFDWVEKLLIPKYHKAKKSLSVLINNKEVNTESEGINEIERILINHLKAVPENKGKEEILSNSKLKRISFSMGSTVVSSGEPLRMVGARLDYKGQEVVVNDVNIEVIKKGVDQLKEKRVFKLEAILFWIGIVLIFLSRIVDNIVGGTDIIS